MTDRQPRVALGTRTSAPLGPAMGDFQAAVVRLARVDPVTTELVRMQCARHHDCHT